MFNLCICFHDTDHIVSYLLLMHVLKKYILKKCALFGVSGFNLCICFHDTDHIVSYLLLPSSVLVPSTKKDMATQASIHVWKIP